MKLVMATIHLEESTRAIPLAAACLKAAAPKHDIELKNYTLEDSAGKIAEELASDKSCGCIGFPIYLWNRSLVLEIIAVLKSIRPELPVIAGGPDVTAAPKAFLDDSGIELVMQGEGEELINPVLDALEAGEPFPRIPGLSTVDFFSPQSAFCKDINTLESPILSGALDLKQNHGLLWELSRGCPFACEFCFESKGSGLVRVFDTERIKKELKVMREAGIQQVFVLDPTFNVNRDRVLSILGWIRELTPGTYYYFEIRTEFLDEKTAEAFATVPCTLQIGLQSSSPEVLKNINRNFDPEEFRAKTDLLGQAGVSFGVDLIYGLPGDSLSGFRKSIDYALSLEPNHLDLFPLAVLPGTALYDRRNDLHIKADKSDPYIVRETPDFSPEDLKAAGELSEACDSLYNENRGISWFSRVCYDLEMSAVDLVEKWKNWSASAVPQNIQLKDFLRIVYKEAGRSQLYPVLEDLFGYLDILEELENGESSSTPEEQIFLKDDLKLSLHSSCRVQELHLHPTVVMSGFPASSEELMEETELFRTLFWLRDYELCVDLLTEEEEKILGILKDKDISYKDLKASYQGIDEFILSGILEAYIVVR
jgi:radical SAM superfamily enzyme YgiQ (UPF0313 family)